MNRWLILGLVLGMGASAQADLRGEWKAGQKAYAREDFAAALKQFEAARSLAVQAGLDTAKLDANRGSALFRSGQLEEAETAFARAVQTADLAVQADAWFNLGCARLARGKLVLKEKQAKAADDLFAAAMEAFRQSLKLRSDDLDAKINFELTLVERQKLRGYVLGVRDQIANSDALIQQRQYAQALALLSQPTEDIDMAVDLEPELKQALEQRQERTGQLVQLIEQLQQPAAAPEGSP